MSSVAQDVIAERAQAGRAAGVSAMTRALVVILATAVARLVYLAFFSPYELTADEAQYWDWSRRLQLSDHSKGPGIVWLIAASTWMFGHAEWAVRLPTVIASGISMISLAALALDMRTPDTAPPGVAWKTAALFVAVPAFQLSGLLVTPDGPYVACWCVAALAGWKLLRPRPEPGRPSRVWWIVLACALGLGFLIKYTIVLIVPGMMAFAWLQRGDPDHRPPKLADVAFSTLLFLAIVSPVVIWNVTHDWAGIRHLLGFMALPGGDRPPDPTAWSPRWVLAYVFGQIAVIGPLTGVVLLAALSARRTRHQIVAPADLFLALCAAPMLLLFLLVSFRNEVEGNWPLAAFSTLIVLAARTLSRHDASRSMRRWQQAAFAYGTVAALAIHFPALVAAAPVVGRFVPLHRLSGFAREADEVSRALDALRRTTGIEPIVIAASHNGAGRLAFYLPNHPRVASAGRYFGARPSSYDFFEDVDLSAPSATGRPVCLYGASPDAWNSLFAIEGLRSATLDGRVALGDRYLGPRRVAAR